MNTDESAVPRHALLVGSSGGHLAQLLELEPWWRSWRRTWVTFETADAVSEDTTHASSEDTDKA